MTDQEKKKIGDPKIVTDAVEVAEEAGLRYVSADQPGYTRKAKGDDFEYFDTEGKPIRDEQRLLRIKGLAIPPAYTDVWICPSANGHVDLCAVFGGDRIHVRVSLVTDAFLNPRSF